MTIFLIIEFFFFFSELYIMVPQLSYHLHICLYLLHESGIKFVINPFFAWTSLFEGHAWCGWYSTSLITCAQKIVKQTGSVWETVYSNIIEKTVLFCFILSPSKKKNENNMWCTCNCSRSKRPTRPEVTLTNCGSSSGLAVN